LIVGDVPPDKSSSPVHAGGFCLLEGDANSFLFSPDDVTSLTKIARDKVDGNLVGNACGASDVKSSAACRNIADGAFDVLAVELNRSGLEYTLANCCASVDHTPVI
jgi:hypothetical protein